MGLVTESREPQDIEYILSDVLELGKIGNFDLVVASYLLNYAQTKEQLLKMCQSIFVNLKPGGRFVIVEYKSFYTFGYSLWGKLKPFRLNGDASR